MVMLVVMVVITTLVVVVVVVVLIIMVAVMLMRMVDMLLMIIFYDVLISCFDLIIIIFCISPFNSIMHAGNYMVSVANGGWHFLDINKQTCLSKVEIVDID